MKQEDIKRLWEWCGFKKDKYTTRLYSYPDNSAQYAELPELTLDNLFKYAVPKFGYAEVTYKYYLSGMTYYAKVICGIRREAWAKTPAEALAQAILKVIDR